MEAGKAMADAAAAAGVKVFVFSALEDAEKRSKASHYRASLHVHFRHPQGVVEVHSAVRGGYPDPDPDPDRPARVPSRSHFVNAQTVAPA